ncbi:MAG: DUF4238 domain-containing protein [Microcoleus sp. CAN_BIN18]|nr:DUF4238 domain-containing protein [Microcoleus sp. CAN_BIN18]
MFDERSGWKIIRSSVDNLCAEKSFYCFSVEIEDEDTGILLDYDYDYDKPVFDEIDGGIAPIVKQIVSQGSVDVLTDDNRKKLAKYVTYQYIRSPAAKNLARYLTPSERDARQIQGLSLLEESFINDLSNIIYNLKLKLVKANDDVEYVISDSPVLLSLNAEGIYFPISPDYCLCYQKENADTLNSICINEIEFITSVRFNISKSKEVLTNIWQNTHQEYISKFCGTGIPSYWKCILKNKDWDYCIENFKDNIFE